MTKGDIYTIAGDGTAGYAGDSGPATSAELDRPLGLGVDSHGDLLIADYSNNRVRLVAAADCSSACPLGITAMTKGDIYTIAGDGTPGHSGDGGPATNAELASASDVAVDGHGDVLIADPNSSRVRLVAGTDCASGCPLGLMSMTKGDIYTVAGSVFGASSGDGGPAIDATMTPSGVGLDGQGDLLIADTVTVRLVAGRDCSAGCPYGLTSMTEGDIYTVAGSFFQGHSGDGGRATNAELQGPADLKVDANGDLLIADSNAVRLVAAYFCSTQCPFGLTSMTASYIYTIAGSGVPGFSGDGGPATSAQLGRAFGLAVDGTGDLLIADIDNNRVRQVTPGAVAPRETLSVSQMGSGSGQVSSAPVAIDCGAVCSAGFAQGTLVTLTATPTNGSVFTGWSGGGCSGTSSCVVTVNSDTSATATFTRPPQETLQVVLAGAGSGSVSGGGISCPGACSTSVTQGSQITLNATPTLGSSFTGWSGGGCSGTGRCVVTMNAAVFVTATFTKSQTGSGSSPSAAQIIAVLAGEMIPSGKLARIAAILKSGRFAYKTFTLPEAGTATLSWYHLHRSSKDVVAIGKLTLSKAGTGRLTMRLTAAGRKLLRTAKKMRLTAEASFTPARGAKVATTRAIALKR